jgi:hypothetical protein
MILNNPLVRVNYDPEPNAASLHGQPDEDYWPNPVQPVAASLYQSLPYLFPNEEIVPQPGTTLAPDEDFWSNPVQPVPATFYQSLPYAFADKDEIPAGSLLAPSEPGSGDGSWSAASFINGSANPLFSYNYDPQDAPGNILPTPFQGDEGFWANPIQPDIPEPTILLFADDWAINPNFDEDFWSNPVAPIDRILLAPQQWTFGTEEFVPAPVFQGQADEDYWVNPVAPVDRVLLAPQQHLFDQNEPGNLFGQFDEDFWINPVAPVWQYALVPQQWQYESHDITVQTLTADDDDTFWSNPVAPVAASMFQQLPYSFDENAWVPFVAPPITSNWLSLNAQLKVSH